MNYSKNEARRPIAGAAFEAAQSFDVEAFAAAYGGVVVSTPKAGVALYAQGDPANDIFFIREGRIQLTVVSSQGKEAILSVLDVGDFCGESCLIASRVRAATALCITDCIVARIERARVVHSIQRDPLIAEFFIAHILNRAFRLRDNLITQLFDCSEKRLAHVLVLLANRGNEGHQVKVVKNIDQEGLAQMIGTTRSRVNHFMNKFRKLGYVDYEAGTIVVHNSLLEFVFRENPFAAPGAQTPSSA